MRDRKLLENCFVLSSVFVSSVYIKIIVHPCTYIDQIHFIDFYVVSQSIIVQSSHIQVLHSVHIKL